MSYKIKNDYATWIDGKEYPEEVELCPCNPGHQEVMDIRFEHVKRDYYWAHYDMLCMECEMCWTDSIYLVGQGRSIIITQMPTEEELPEEEDPCICIPDEPNTNCPSCY